MRTAPTFYEEQQLWNNGYEYVVGIDEVGRGCFAGPLVVGAVIFPKGYATVGTINDSKVLTPKIREQTAVTIKKHALFYAITEIPVEIINSIGIGKATQVGFFEVIQKLTVNPDFILIDAFYINAIERKKQKPIVKGDSISASIAAASVIAKVYRDERMRNLHPQYPEYNFSQNKGYGTLDHRLALKNHGLCEIHRTSFNLQKFL